VTPSRRRWPALRQSTPPMPQAFRRMMH